MRSAILTTLMLMLTTTAALGQCQVLPNGARVCPASPAVTYRYYPVQAVPLAPAPTTYALGAVNAVRAQYGLRALAWDAALAGSCAANSARQSASRRVGHFVQGPASQCAAMSGSEADAARQWLHSPPHRAILLSPHVTRGAVVVSGGYATLEVR